MKGKFLYTVPTLLTFQAYICHAKDLLVSTHTNKSVWAREQNFRSIYERLCQPDCFFVFFESIRLSPVVPILSQFGLALPFVCVILVCILEL